MNYANGKKYVFVWRFALHFFVRSSFNAILLFQRKKWNKRLLVSFQVPSMSYPMLAEAAFLSGPKRLQRFAPYMVYVHWFTNANAFVHQFEEWSHNWMFMSFYILYFRHVVNAFLLCYQIGACCIYVVFIATNLRALINAFNVDIDVRLIMVFILLPLILINWVNIRQTNCKRLQIIVSNFVNL